MQALDFSQPVGPLFDLPLRTGTIHSCFRRAVNVAIDDTMLVLLSSELPRMPNSLRLPSVVARDLLGRLRPGMEVRMGDRRLLIPACDFSLGLPEALPWEPRPEIAMRRWQPATAAQHARLLAYYLTNQRQQDGLLPLVGALLLGRPIQETPLVRMALPALRMLARASWRLDRAGVEEAALALVGLGPGLTPAGDDILGGFAAVMALLSPHLSADARPRDHIAGIIAAASQSRTTLLSAVLLAFAARGEVAEHVGELLLALALPAEEFEAVLYAAKGVLAYGATSGGDILLGILLGLRTLEGDCRGEPLWSPAPS